MRLPIEGRDGGQLRLVVVEVGVEAVAIVVERQIDTVKQEFADRLSAEDQVVDVGVGSDEVRHVRRHIAQSHIDPPLHIWDGGETRELLEIDLIDLDSQLRRVRIGVYPQRGILRASQLQISGDVL